MSIPVSEELTRVIASSAREFGARTVWLFGSIAEYARGGGVIAAP